MDIGGRLTLMPICGLLVSPTSVTDYLQAPIAHKGTGLILYKLLFLHLPYPDTDDYPALLQEILTYPG